MKKKLLATTLIVALAAGTLVGCGSTETPTETAVVEEPTEVEEVVVETEEIVEETETETEIETETEEPYIPTASEEDIAKLQEQIDMLGVAYEQVDPEFMKLVEKTVLTDIETDRIAVEDAKALALKAYELYPDNYGNEVDWSQATDDEFKSDAYFYSVAVAMGFLYYMNMEDFADQYTMTDVIHTNWDTIESYASSMAADPENFLTFDIPVYMTLGYISKIENGNPTVIDILEYDEPISIGNTTSYRYALVDVAGEQYIAYLLGEENGETYQVVNILPTDNDYIYTFEARE